LILDFLQAKACATDRAGACALLCAVVFLSCIGSVAAHELGAIRVLAEFKRDGTYTVDCIVDREHLSPGFGARARYPPKAGRIRGVRKEDETSIGQLLSEVADRVRLDFDGRRQAPKLEWIHPDATAAEVTLRLSGAIPRGAAMFAFANDAKIGSYLLTVITEGVDEVRRQWQEGGEEGLAVVLRAGLAPPNPTGR
jgi:hypothetical protein